VENAPPFVIAIDGPAGAGKSTVARGLALRLGFFLLDTGALYRALALAARDEGIDWADEERLAARAAALAVEFTDAADHQRVLLDGRDVTQAIRTPDISTGASRVSALPRVREALLELQRSIARRGRCVVEGRDIGTVVLPWAPLKFFLTASEEERARRRHVELLGRGQVSDLERTRAEMVERDRRDESRAAAPLRRADDALLLDTSSLSVEQALDRMEAEVRARLGHR
jgi:cytidylate kinase